MGMFVYLGTLNSFIAHSYSLINSLFMWKFLLQISHNQSKALVYVYITRAVCFSYLGKEIVRSRISESPKKIRQLALNVFITVNNINSRSKESDVSDQNVVARTQSLSDFEIARPVENKQDKRSGSLPSMEVGRHF